MVKMNYSGSQSQAKSVSAIMTQKQMAYKTTLSALSVFEGAGELSGAAYAGAKDYSASVLRPLLQGAQLLSEGLTTATGNFPSEYADRVEPKSLDSEELQEEINELRSFYDATSRTLSLLISKRKKSVLDCLTISSLEGVTSVLKSRLDKLEEKIDKLMAFNAYSPSIFSDLSALESAVSQGLNQVNSSFSTFNGKFEVPEQSEMEWAQRITNYVFAKEYDVKRPKDMSSEDYDTYLNIVYGQVDELEKDGWSPDAIKKGYIKTINSTYDTRIEIPMDKQLQEINYQAHQVGSDVFNAMLVSAYPDTKEGQVKTLNMIYKVLGAEVDENGFLQMTNMKLTDSDQQGSYQFMKDMDAALTFDDVFSGIVQGAYPKGLPTDLEAGSKAFDRAQKTHQFRYYLDYKNNVALRSTYPNYDNDLERLKAYNAAHPDNQLVGEKARLHNKYQGHPEDYQAHIDDKGENYKYVTPSNKNGFHSEYIINDKSNNLVSQWNAYEFDENGHVNSDPNKIYSKDQQMELVDGNSVNYAEKDGKSHGNLDSKIVNRYDPEVRKKIGEEWKSPITGSDVKDEQNYFDTDKSKKNADKKLK